MNETLKGPDPLNKRNVGPPPLWVWMLLAGLVGGIIGLGVLTFSYAEGVSYFSDDPSACVNCHVMRDVFDGWNKSSHKSVATCNDCHTPHTPVAKYAIKAINGWNHSVAFTTGNFPEPIRINQRNRVVAQNNCLYCHADLVAQISHRERAEPTDCLNCHVGVGHGR